MEYIMNTFKYIYNFANFYNPIYNDDSGYINDLLFNYNNNTINCEIIHTFNKEYIKNKNIDFCVKFYYNNYCAHTIGSPNGYLNYNKYQSYCGCKYSCVDIKYKPNFVIVYPKFNTFILKNKIFKKNI